MRKLVAFPLLLFALLAAGCESPTDSGRRTLIGQWTSSGFAGTTIRMGLTEVAREVHGAGSWVEADLALAFQITGTHAEETVSLLLDFEEIPDVNFLGGFTDEDTLVGTLTGGVYRDRPITFVRVEPEE